MRAEIIKGELALFPSNGTEEHGMRYFLDTIIKNSPDPEYIQKNFTINQDDMLHEDD